MSDALMQPSPRHALLTRSALLLLLAQAAACAQPPADNLTPSRQAAPLPAPALQADPPAAQSFAQWRETFRQRALAEGVNAALLARVLTGLQPDPSVIRADASQPEFSKPIWEYLDSAASVQRVKRGQQLLVSHARTLEAIERRYGVPRQVLVAVWGMESNFGGYTGNKSVIRSLATLAHEGRRPQFAHEQLLAALRILQQGDIAPERMLGSWAGAMGQTQFIPTTYLQHAVDFDGNGKRDIWHSVADALASTANYLRASGWKSGQSWGSEVQLPTGFDYALADPEQRRPLGEWLSLGLRIVGSTQALDLRQPASLLLPAGHRGPAFLVFDNFRSILRYNNSTAYALGIGLLAERFEGGGQILASWPRSEPPLSRSQRIELQQQLSARGFDPGISDGIIGANTRRAVRASQQQLGWPADGHPTLRLLEALRDTPH
ncbi:lytic murein transglycosylase [Pseudomonas sp. NW5]|uniref:lytic murein transglycosylase n=1 Tax=Pseudomonas sp. NW5 TaxID=2934934 RepID=UPI00202205D1|nr:lytic murein transglycosylase [Pseudomonas sp. NW5]MCL7462443.1 lytic murein transglycosylase [Pseudomonas sp. NW5]